MENDVTETEFVIWTFNKKHYVDGEMVISSAYSHDIQFEELPEYAHRAFHILSMFIETGVDVGVKTIELYNIGKVTNTYTHNVIRIYKSAKDHV